nr:EOG090X0G6M [Lepidurus arcticus]
MSPVKKNRAVAGTTTSSGPWIWIFPEYTIIIIDYQCVGSYRYTSSSSHVLGLFLKLHFGERRWALVSGIFNLVERETAKRKLSDKRSNAQTKRILTVFQSVAEYIQKRKDLILSKAEAILMGKRKKFEKEHPGDEFNETKALEEELSKIKPFAESSTKIPILISHPCLSSYDHIGIELPVPSEIESIRRKTYAALWESGVFLTSGEKFGGDFLVYPCDPCLCHAQCIAVCVKGPVTGRELVSKGRLGTSVKKTVVFCYELNDEIRFQSIQWMNIS